MSTLYDDALIAAGLNVAQYPLLKNLQGLNQPCIASLAEAVGLGRSTLRRKPAGVRGPGLLRPGLRAWQQEQQEQLTRRIGPQQNAAAMALLDDLETLD
ncbi:MAG: MarR family transcriptional regulator [Pseudomonas sp.]|uniref:MarR family transcriptional regulator n=1 Tax=Pseudomonas sp. TaxID=306 RepID=UPI00299E5ED1|nr:MarR family transcriptional regulator [Pseudomonas sp.]MDX1722608.1 MarR family transcriptional regulator [Pseudomonas sp.]